MPVDCFGTVASLISTKEQVADDVGCCSSALPQKKEGDTEDSGEDEIANDIIEHRIRRLVDNLEFLLIDRPHWNASY